MPSRWDHLFDLKPVALLDHLLEEVARLLAKDLDAWPPPVQDLDPATLGEFAPLFQEATRRPDPAVYTEALRLAIRSGLVDGVITHTAVARGLLDGL